MSWGKYGRITSITEITICFKNVLHNMWDQPFNILYTSAASIWRFLWWIVTGLSLERSSLKSALYYVPLVPYVPTCLRTFAPLLLICFRVFLMPYVRLYFYVLSFLYVFYVPLFFYVPYVSSFFYVPYMPSFFTCLTWVHFLLALCTFTFSSISNFWRALCAFTFYKIWNNP